MKTDTPLTPIGHTLTTYDGHAEVFRTWRVVWHGYNPYVGRRVEMVVLQATEVIGDSAT